MNAEARTVQERLEQLLPELSGSEYKIVFYLYNRLERADSEGVCLTDEELTKATRISPRQVKTVRESL